MNKLKVTGSPLRVIHYEYNIKTGEILNTDPTVDFKFQLGKNPKTLESNSIRLRWTVRIIQGLNTKLSYIAEDDYKFENLLSITIQNFTDLLNVSLKRAFADLNKRNNYLEVSVDLEEEVIYKQFGLLKSQLH